MSSSKKVAIAYHSGFGHTAYLSQFVAKGLRSEGANLEVVMVNVADEKLDWDLLGSADMIVWGSPTYMGNVSGEFKKFMDASSKLWMQQAWANKLSAGFTVSGSPSGDKLATLQALATFALQHGMIWVGYARIPETYSGKAPEISRNRLGSFTGLMAQPSNQAPESSFVEGDLASAEDFGSRLAQVLKRFS